MIGLQKYLIDNNIKVIKLASELQLKPPAIWRWFKINSVPQKYWDFLSEKFQIEKEYINKKVNDISTYHPKKMGFNKYKVCGDYTEIYVTNKNNENFTILIDTEDLPKLIELDYRWNANAQPSIEWAYACATYYTVEDNGKKKGHVVKLHHLILGITDGRIVDHINHNRLDNRKCNLRIIPHDKNTKNRKSKNTNNSSGYRNVHWNENKGMWMVQLQVNGKNTRFGYFNDNELEKAGALAEELRQKYYGKYKGLN